MTAPALPPQLSIARVPVGGVTRGALRRCRTLGRPSRPQAASCDAWSAGNSDRSGDGMTVAEDRGRGAFLGSLALRPGQQNTLCRECSLRAPSRCLTAWLRAAAVFGTRGEGWRCSRAGTLIFSPPAGGQTGPFTSFVFSYTYNPLYFNALICLVCSKLPNYCSVLFFLYL